MRELAFHLIPFSSSSICLERAKRLASWVEQLAVGKILKFLIPSFHLTIALVIESVSMVQTKFDRTLEGILTMGIMAVISTFYPLRLHLLFEGIGEFFPLSQQNDIYWKPNDNFYQKKGDMRALEDLTYSKRREFISKYTLPIDFPLLSFHTEASIAPGVLATLSHIAHAEVPWLPLPGPISSSQEIMQGTKLPVVIPLAAAMAVCALHLDLRYGEKSDGLVTRKDAEVPGSVVVRPDRKLDHAWMVYSSSKNDCKEPNASQMCEALLTLLVEIGKRKKGSSEIPSPY
eukprot:Gb_05021 [translate_table: standard]